MKSIIVGTAGHIDHGKTTLIRALTGIDTDRLPEEKRRGITIDLGFAELTLGDFSIGFIDVPGHQRFVKNMLAGAHGMDMVMLVIAADESVMPQTREHFEICRMLGVKSGVVVITKSDSVDDELLELATDEARDLVRGSFLESSPIVAVSARTMKGIDSLKETLSKLADSVQPRDKQLSPRLPIDRSFTVKGFGTVATGTLLSGSINDASLLELLPMGARVRVRGIQVQGKSVSEAFAGQRTAVNLGGLDAPEVERGMVLAPHDLLRPTQVVNTECELIRSAPRALHSRSRVRVHLGAAEVMARVRLFEAKGKIEPGSRDFAQLRFEAPIVAISGDRFVIRSYSPSQTIGGGVILDPFAVKHRAKSDSIVRGTLSLLANATPTKQIPIFIVAAGDRGLSRAELCARTGMPREEIEAPISAAISGRLVEDAEGVLIAAGNFDGLADLVVSRVGSEQDATTLSRGVSRESIRERIFAHSRREVFLAVLARLIQTGRLVAEKELLRTPDHRVELGEKELLIRDKLDALFLNAKLAPPTPAELAEHLVALGGIRQDLQKHIKLLVDSGHLVRVSNEFLFHNEALKELIAQLKHFARTNLPDRVIDVAAFKALTNVSRKHAIPLLEYLDRVHVTKRAGNNRIVL